MLMTIPELLAAAGARLRKLDAASALAEVTRNHGVVIDVREPAEVQAKPAAGSINIPRGMLEMTVSEKFPDPGQAIYLHCASSTRAILAAEQLERLGYSAVTVITCPIDVICAALEP